MKKILASTFAFVCLMPLHAQTVTFETEDYKAVGVYDTWEASPFRTGVLEGNAAVVENPYRDELNATDHVLGVQRSRHGSNTFGARIDLTEPFELTTTHKYVHVLVHKPTGGRVMLVGLGKRRDRAGQNPDAEQFWERSLPAYEVVAGQWFDAVFAVKGNGGIDIRSLVVVVDAESPHALAEDFVAYVDEVEVNNSPTSRTATLGDYPVCFAKQQTYTRSDRRLNSVSLQSPSGGTTTISAPGDLCYNEVFTPTFKAKAGERVKPSVSYKGSWMHTYVYLDKGQDGKFSCELATNGGVSEESDLVSFSYLDDKNAAGQTLTNKQSIDPAEFTVPATLPCGFYRMRYKIDWNNADPAGNDGASGQNYIIDNGGAMMDVRLNVHDDMVAVTRDGGLNGDIVKEDGTEFVADTAPFGQGYKVWLKPAPGFSIDYLTVRHGYNLDGEAMLHSTPQWSEEQVPAEDFAADGSFTLPAEWMDGDVRLTPEFISTADVKPVIGFSYDLQWQGQSKLTQQVHGKVGTAMPSVDTTPLPPYTTASTPEGQITADMEGQAVPVAVLPDGLPFECYLTADDVERWYYVGITANMKYIYDPGTAQSIALNRTNPDEGAGANKFIWGFVGDPFDGFRLLNCDTHKVLATKIDNMGTNTGGSTYPVTKPADALPTGYHDVWDIQRSAEYAEGFYLSVHGKGNGTYRMNSRDGKLAFWTGGADAGSAFRVMEAEPLPDAIMPLQGNLGTTTASGLYDLTGRRLGQRPAKAIYIEDGHKKKAQ